MKKLFIALFSILLWASSAQAVYYVGKLGSTGNPGNNANNCTAAQNPATPKLTITNMLDNCFTYGVGSAANQVVEVSAGTYDEDLSRGESWPRGSSWSAPFILRAKPGDAVTIRPSSGPGTSGTYFYGAEAHYIEVRGFKYDGINRPTFLITIYAPNIRIVGNEFVNVNGYGFIGSGAPSAGSAISVGGDGHHVEIQNNKFIDPNSTYGPTSEGCREVCFGYPMYIGAQNPLVEGNEYAHYALWGVHLYPGPSNGIVRNNIFRNGGWSNVCPNDPRCGDRTQGVTPGGVLASGSPGHLIYNNIIHDIPNGEGINLYWDGGSQVYNNTIYNMGGVGIVSGNSAGNIVRNNIVYNVTEPVDGDFYSYTSPDTTTYSNNLCARSGRGCAVVGNPGFVDPANGDFRLASNSPAIGIGADLSSVFTTDFNDTTRTVPWDIGALKSGVVGPSKPVVNITSPTNNPNYAVASATFALGGTATSGVSIAKVTWACPTCTPTSGTAKGTSSWSIAGITLASGNNVITVTATDNSGQSAVDVITVSFTVQVQTLVYAAGFDEGSGTSILDSSGNGNTGTLGNGALRVSGIAGGAILFDGAADSVITVPSSSSLSLTHGYTVSMYIAPTEIDTNTWRAILNRFSSYWFYATTGDNTCPFGNRPYGGYETDQGFESLCSNSPLVTGSWTYLTFRWDGVTQEVYFGTTLISSRAATGVIKPSSNPMMIGNSPFLDPLEGFKGFMDRVRIYNYGIPLTAGKNTCGDTPSITRDMNCRISTTLIEIKLNLSSLKTGPGITRKHGPVK
jgi:hypothetical protein